MAGGRAVHLPMTVQRPSPSSRPIVAAAVAAAAAAAAPHIYRERERVQQGRSARSAESAMVLAGKWRG